MARNSLFNEWRSRVELETKRRINLAVWAYAYEFENDSLVPDEKFDRECRLVDLTISTSRPDLDDWFKREFDPSTGVWIHKHPELQKIRELYQRYYKK